MPTGIDLIGGNAALQEHWIKRVIAIIIDAIVLAVVTVVLNALFQNALFALGLWWTFITGLIWLLYSALLEGSSGRATISERLPSKCRGSVTTETAAAPPDSKALASSRGSISPKASDHGEVRTISAMASRSGRR